MYSHIDHSTCDDASGFSNALLAFCLITSYRHCSPHKHTYTKTHENIQRPIFVRCFGAGAQIDGVVDALKR